MKLIPLAGALLLAAGTAFAQTDGPVLRVAAAEDQIVNVRAKTRHTTVIVLPATETVLDFVVGDSEYWHLTGAANLAFLKPVAEGRHHQRRARLRFRAYLLVPGDRAGRERSASGRADRGAGGNRSGNLPRTA